MKTWNDYKEHVRTVDPEIGKDIDEVENISSISLQDDHCLKFIFIAGKHHITAIFIHNCFYI
jgi:hypothetical protein